VRWWIRGLRKEPQREPQDGLSIGIVQKPELVDSVFRALSNHKMDIVKKKFSTTLKKLQHALEKKVAKMHGYRSNTTRINHEISGQRIHGPLI
jgi:hypothetical protein